MTMAIRDAATVMLMRDSPEGMQVFMLRRNLNSDFVGGAYVFPGGAVDLADRDDPELNEICVGRDGGRANELLGLEEGALAFWVAAIRECFEEAGVLLAQDDTGGFVSFADADVAARFDEHRRAVDSGDRRLADVCRAEGLVLPLGDIHYFAHWITPRGPTRRYDTRFYVCMAPEEQVPLHDNRETVASLWVNPNEALAMHARGELDLILPTIKNLEAIGRFDRAADLLAAAARVGAVPSVEPVIVRDSGGVRILLPGDPGYEEAFNDEPEDGTVIV
ncbi:MAG: hypothetical protein ACC652_02285 [Acidimicrobiales bacterium]